MTTEVSVWLFGKPSWEMNIEGGNATPEMLREKATELKEHLEHTAGILEKLQNSGWVLVESYGAVYSLDLCKDMTLQQAAEELCDLGVSSEEVDIRELEEEVEEE